jgi:hypothetical protein
MHRPATRTSLKTSGTSAPVKSLPQKYFVSPEVFAEEQKNFLEAMVIGRASESHCERWRLFLGIGSAFI